MSDRSPYYRGLSIPQIEALASVSDSQFQAWVTRGAPVKDIDDLLNEKIEEKRVRESKGQIDPSQSTVKVRGTVDAADLGDGKVGEFSLQLRPNREPNSYDIEAAKDAYQAFLGKYQQVLPSDANHAIIHKFLSSRGAMCTANNYAIAYAQLWGSLTLRLVEKGVATSETKLTDSRGKRVQVAPYHFAKPVESKLFETILSPKDVRALSADETQKLMRPLVFPSITSSANDYAKSAEFIAENPEQPRGPEQTLAQKEFEVKAFATSHPEYARYLGDAERYGGLYQLILEQISKAGLLLSDASLLDGFKWAEREGILPTEDTTQRGQVVAVHVTPDGRPGYWTKASVRRAVEKMSSSELLEAMNSDVEFRNLLDSM